MSWLSKKLMKSASKNTGLFSWGQFIPGVGGGVEYADRYLDKKAKEQKIGAFAEETSLTTPDTEKFNLGSNLNLAIIGIIAYMSGFFK